MMRLSGFKANTFASQSNLGGRSNSIGNFDNRTAVSMLIDLEVESRRAVVVGLGSVGRRRASSLVTEGAVVLVIDPDPAAVAGAPRGVEVRCESFRPEHLDGATLVFAAATPEVNRQVVAEAKARGVWVNSASDPAEGDFAVPAVWRDGPIAVAVSTSGLAPGLAATLRDRAAQAVGPTAANLAKLWAELRPEARRRLTDPQTRRALLRDWSDPRWLALAESEGVEAVGRAWRGALDSTCGSGTETVQVEGIPGPDDEASDAPED